MNFLIHHRVKLRYKTVLLDLNNKDSVPNYEWITEHLIKKNICYYLRATTFEERSIILRFEYYDKTTFQNFIKVLIWVLNYFRNTIIQIKRWEILNLLLSPLYDSFCDCIYCANQSKQAGQPTQQISMKTNANVYVWQI